MASRHRWPLVADGHSGVRVSMGSLDLSGSDVLAL
jgi:hypothetical protein